MQDVIRRLVLAVLLVVVFGSFLPRSSWSPAAEGDRPAAPDNQWLGVASCAATACHGMNGPQGARGCEYTTWITDDPHAKAYTALFNDRSKQIQKNLNGKTGKVEAYENALCLKCHAMNVPKEKQGPRFALEDGVGCESCHGPSEKWLGVHHLPEVWGGKSPAEKLKLGMRPTKNLLDRAQICAECHVGSADRQVNHDLIAAGHPRLNFEFGTYLANLPKHWQEKGDNARNDFEARAWAVGQVASLDAALNLLEARAAGTVGGGKKDSPVGERPVWPEFAEYDCFACHHGLKDEEWRRNRYTTKDESGKRLPGSYPWSPWYTAMIPLLAKELPASSAGQVGPELEKLAGEMSKVYPNKNNVKEQVGKAKGLLEGWAEELNRRELTRETVAKLLHTVAADEAGLAKSEWDSRAQLYLALAALHQARLAEARPGVTDRRKDPFLTPLDKLFQQVGFQTNYNSPHGRTPEDFQKALSELQGLLPK